MVPSIVNPDSFSDTEVSKATIPSFTGALSPFPVTFASNVTYPLLVQMQQYDRPTLYADVGSTISPPRWSAQWVHSIG